MMHFFDHNATTPLVAEARTAWLEANQAHWLNPSSPYRAGAAVHARLEAARARLAEMLGVDPRRIVFNSGATEGNNAVMATWARSLPADARIGVGVSEHPSVLEAAQRYFSGRLAWLKPAAASGGVISPEAADWTGLAAISVMAANNETGILNPWQDWAEACRGRGIPLHCDASQWIGKMPLDGLGACDYVVGCAHKFGGPKGVGFLLLPPNAAGVGLAGGEQERGRRAGTEDVAGVLAMLAALEVVESKRPAGSAQPKSSFLAAIQTMLPGVVVIGAGLPTLWNTVSLIMPEFASSRWIRRLEQNGFLVSAGSACSTGQQGPSHVLAALGIDPDAASRALRISSGWQTTAGDWDALLAAILASYRQLKAEAADSGSQVLSI